MAKSNPIPRMTSKQMAEAARKLGHLGMEALWQENKKLRGFLEHAMEMITPTDECAECDEIRAFLDREAAK